MHYWAHIKMKKEKLLTLRELKEDLAYLESNEEYAIATINLFKIFLEDRYLSEKSLSDGTIEIYRRRPFLEGTNCPDEYR